MAGPNGEYDAEKRKYAQFLQHGCDNKSGHNHEIATAPLFTLSAKYVAENESNQTEGVFQFGAAKNDDDDVLPQYGLLGFSLVEQLTTDLHEPIMLNTNAPNSISICGSQGSGKSYTLSAMLENLLQPKAAPGKPGNPVAGVVFHYDIDSSGSIAEAAHLASLGIKVELLVSKSNEHILRTAYTKAVKNSTHLRVRTLELRSKDLSVQRMNKLMAFADHEGKVPLYMEVIQRILREMAIASQGGDFSYRVFHHMLNDESARFTREQANPMNLRLALLESFMVPDARRSKDKSSLLNLQPGTLTIIDLSDPFVDASTVCVLFDICLSLIQENAPASGLVVALDEAHKFMNKSLAATNFTDRLLTTIREQRHNGTRVIISTQEPTISDKLLDLCSVTIVHRFTSPAWFEAIRNHISGASSLISEKEDQRELMKDIVNLDTGESFLFSPSSYLPVYEGQAYKLGCGNLRMKTRLRVGDDGGRSKMARADGGGDGVDGIVNGLSHTALK